MLLREVQVSWIGRVALAFEVGTIDLPSNLLTTVFEASAIVEHVGGVNLSKATIEAAAGRNDWTSNTAENGLIIFV